jgi:hypothetical protein
LEGQVKPSTINLVLVTSCLESEERVCWEWHCYPQTICDTVFHWSAAGLQCMALFCYSGFLHQ